MLLANVFSLTKSIQLQFNYLDQLSIILNDHNVFFKQKEFGMDLMNTAIEIDRASEI
jgi:hypothetical protein